MTWIGLNEKMYKSLAITIGLVAPSVLILAAQPAYSASLSSSIENALSDGSTPVKVDYSLIEVDNGVQFNFEVDTSVNLADLRGIYLNIDDTSLLSGLSVSSVDNPFGDIDDANFYTVKSRDLAVDASGTTNFGFGGGNNLNGGKSTYTIGLDIGQQGLKGTKDDFQGTSFILKHSAETLLLENFANLNIGTRLMSVGPGPKEKNREGSSKVGNTVPEAPSPDPDPTPVPTPVATSVATPIPTWAPEVMPKEVPEPAGLLGLIALGGAVRTLRRRRQPQ